MLIMKYIGTETEYEIEFNRKSSNVVQLLGDFPECNNGFTLSRIGHSDGWDYKEYRTIYKKVDGGIEFSDNGSVYVEPEQPLEPEPYIPTLEELKDMKIVEMNAAQQETIQAGINVVLSNGTTEHFTLTEHDQTSLMGLQTQVTQGAEGIPWHNSDISEHCKYYSNEDMALIVTKAMQFVTFHVTYFRDLRIYINSMEEKENVEDVTYGIYIPSEYQSEVLADIYASMSNA